jgi:hypothetical protein
MALTARLTAGPSPQPLKVRGTFASIVAKQLKGLKMRIKKVIRLFLSLLGGLTITISSCGSKSAAPRPRPVHHRHYSSRISSNPRAEVAVTEMGAG